MNTDTRHVIKFCGATYNGEATFGRKPRVETIIYAMSYGPVGVYADKACNYSYREFWL